GPSKALGAVFLRSSNRSPDTHRSESRGGILDETSDGGPCGISRRNSGRARSPQCCPHGQGQRASREILEAAGYEPTVLALLRLLKDSPDSSSDWSWISDFIEKLPPDIADLEEVRETNAFALSNAGKPIDAIAKLEELIARSGPTPERLGLLGGR